MSRLLLLLMSALLVVARQPAAAGPPDPPPLDPTCTLYQVSIGDDCGYETRELLVTTPGAELTLNQPGGSQFGTALGCGTDGCVYWGNVFVFFNTFGGSWSSGVSVAGDCPSYAGLVSAGTPTRPVPLPPGVCRVRFDPPTLRSPGQWALVNSFVSRGIFPTQAISHFITVPPEFFRLAVIGVDPIGNKKPNTAYAIRPGADPTHAQCFTTLSVNDWLPDRVLPDCLRLGETGLSNYLPDGLWDVVAIFDPAAVGKVRAMPTPWTTNRVRIQGADTTVEVRRIPNLDLAVSIELLGGDEVVGLNEVDTARVTLIASKQGVVGEIRGIGFSTGRNVVQAQGTTGDGRVDISPPTPQPPATGFSMFPGDVRTFDVPIRGANTGPLTLFVRGGGITRWFGEDRIASATLPIEVVRTPPPPVRPTTVCGLDVFTFVAGPSTYETLLVESASGIEAGAELVVDPCTPDAEEVTVETVAGTTLTVRPAMQKVHPTNTPIVRRPLGATTTTTLQPGATTTTTLAAGATTTTTLGDGGATTTTTLGDGGVTTTTTTTTLPPCTSARCQVNGALGGAACGGNAIPSPVVRKLDQAVAALDAAQNQPAKKAKRTRSKARRLLKSAGMQAARGARGKKPKLTDACADAIRDAASTVAGGIPR